MNPYQKPSPMTREQKELLQKENDLRYLFAEKKNDPRLSDPHVLLLNVFENESTFNYQPEDEEEVCRHAEILVANFSFLRF